jgi:hypothetical protein
MNRKTWIVAFSIVLLSSTLLMPVQEALDEGAIKALVQTAYVDGLMNLGDLEKTRAGFHPDFVLLGVQDGKLTRLPIADWIAGKEKQKAQGQKPPLTVCKFLLVDVTGNAAAVKLELRLNGRHVFTDYLSLYKFPDGWKVVGKIYYRHT